MVDNRRPGMPTFFGVPGLFVKPNMLTLRLLVVPVGVLDAFVEDETNKVNTTLNLHVIPGARL